MDILKALILAAGVTLSYKEYPEGGFPENYKPKCLLKYEKDRTILKTMVNELRSFGIVDIVVVIGYKASEVVDFAEKNNLQLKFVYSLEYSIEKGLTSLLVGLKEFEDDDDILLLFGDCLPSHSLLKNIIDCSSEICFHHAEGSPELHIAKFKKRALGNLMELEDEISKIRLAGSYDRLPLTCGFSAYLEKLGAKRIINGSYKEFDYFRNAKWENIKSMAIILAAGFGKRLGFGIQKTCLMVGERTILERQISILKNYVDKIVVVVGERTEFLETLAKELNFDVVVNPLSKITENIVSLAMGFVYDVEKILIINGDILIRESAIKRIISEEGNILMVERWKGTEATDDTLFYHDYDKEAMKIEYDGEKIINVSKNIGRWETWGEYIGLAKIENVEVLHKAVMDLIKSSQVHVWYEEAFNWMIKNGITFNLSYIESTDFWFEIDTMEDLEKAEKIYND